MFPLSYERHLHIKKKSSPITGRRYLQGCEMLRIPHYLANRFIDGGEVISLTHRTRSALQSFFFLVVLSVRG
jgi:hypothetical protein